jgi:hypothetical protein
MLYVSVLAISIMFTPAEDALLTRIEKNLVPNGMFLDRTSDPETISSAATGMGSLAMAYGAERGFRSPVEVRRLIRSGFENTINANPSRNRGWLSHFTDRQGVPKKGSEVSTIDTALFYFGILRASQILHDIELTNLVTTKLKEIDVQFVMRDKIFIHGFRWDETSTEPAANAQPIFINYLWNDSSEGVILYKLFNLDFKFAIRRVDYPLFVYSYPLCFFEDNTYMDLLQEAVDYQIAKYGYSGVTATDGPHGYTIYDQNLISPLLLSAVGVQFPQALKTLKQFSIDPSVGSYYIPSGWVNRDDLTIDLSCAYILLAQWDAFDATGKTIIQAPVEPVTR